MKQDFIDSNFQMVHIDRQSMKQDFIDSNGIDFMLSLVMYFFLISVKLLFFEKM